MFNNFSNQELIKAVRFLASENKLELSSVIEITQSAILSCLSSIYGKVKFEVKIDADSGKLEILKGYEVVDKALEKQNYVHDQKGLSSEDDNSLSNSEIVEEMFYEPVSLNEARMFELKATLGDRVFKDITHLWGKLTNKNTVIISKFGKYLSSKLNSLIKAKEFEFFKKKEGSLITALVKRKEASGYVLISEGVELYLPSAGVKIDLAKNDSKFPKRRTYRSETMEGDFFKPGDRVQVYIKSVFSSDYDYQVICSRTHPMFLYELFKVTIPEIREEKILIKNVARIAGVRAKVVLHSVNPDISPIGACVGVRGSRLELIKKEIYGEKIDLIVYSSDKETLLANSLGLIRPLKVHIDEEQELVTLVVSDNDLSKLIGKSGSNVKLLSRVIGMTVKLMSPADEKTARAREVDGLIAEMVNALNIDETIAKLLFLEGFQTVSAIHTAEIEKLSLIEGFDSDLAIEINKRAISHVKTQEAIACEEEKRKADLLAVLQPHCSEAGLLLQKLYNSGVTDIELLSDLDNEELREIVEDDGYGFILDQDNLDAIVLSSRRASGRIE